MLSQCGSTRQHSSIIFMQALLPSFLLEGGGSGWLKEPGYSAISCRECVNTRSLITPEITVPKLVASLCFFTSAFLPEQQITVYQWRHLIGLHDRGSSSPAPSFGVRRIPFSSMTIALISPPHTHAREWDVEIDLWPASISPASTSYCWRQPCRKDFVSIFSLNYTHR